MPDSELEYDNESEALHTRRNVLKMLAAAPLLATFGMLASPLMRYMKPTMRPFDFFQPADLPSAAEILCFTSADLPEIWTCLPFMFQMKFVVFNPERYELRQIPAFIIRVENNKNVAFSRMCPLQGRSFRATGSCTQRDTVQHYLSYIRPMENGSCGCRDRKCLGDCIGRSKTPVLYCPHDGSVFDVCNNGAVLVGPAPIPPRQFVVEHNGDVLKIAGFQDSRIIV